MTSLKAKSDTRLTKDLWCLHGLMTALPVTPYYACVWKPCRTEAKKNTSAQFRAVLCQRCGRAWKGKDNAFSLPS